eukprot:283769_1
MSTEEQKQQQVINTAMRYINGDGIPQNIYSYTSTYDLNDYWIITKNIRTDARRGAFTMNDMNVFFNLIKFKDINIYGDIEGFKTDLNQMIEAREGAAKYITTQRKQHQIECNKAKLGGNKITPTLKLPTDHMDITILLNNPRYFLGPTLKNATRRRNYNLRLTLYDVDAMISAWNGKDFIKNILRLPTSPRSITSTSNGNTTLPTLNNPIAQGVNDKNTNTTAINKKNLNNNDNVFEINDEDGTDDEVMILNKNKNVNKNTKSDSETPPTTPSTIINNNKNSDKNEMDNDNETTTINDNNNNNEGIQNNEWQNNIRMIDYTPIIEIPTPTPGGPTSTTDINIDNDEKNQKNLFEGELDPKGLFKQNKYVKTDENSIINYEKIFDKRMCDINNYCQEMFHNIKQDTKNPNLKFEDIRGLLGSYIHRMSQIMSAYRVYFHLAPKPSAFAILLRTLDQNKLETLVFDMFIKQTSVLVNKNFINRKTGERMKPFDKLFIAPQDAYKVYHGKILKTVQFKNLLNPIPNHKKRKPNDSWGAFQAHRKKRLKTKHNYSNKQNTNNSSQIQYDQAKIDDINRQKDWNDYENKLKDLDDIQTKHRQQ